FATVQVGLPDLVQRITLVFPGALQPGEIFQVTDSTANQGAIGAGPTTTRYYLRNVARRILLTGTRDVPSLGPGGGFGGGTHIDVTVPADTPLGTYSVQACADDLKVVVEADENNNCASSGDVFVDRPDLAITVVTNPPASANPGDVFRITDTVKNISNHITAPASTNRYYLSLNTVKGSGDLLLTGSRSIPSLNPGDTSSDFPIITIPADTPGGTYHLLSCADDLDVVVEASESNNCLASSGTVAVSGTGTFELSPTTATVLPDQQVLYTFKWITPTVWRDLASLDLRFVGASDGKPIFWVRWDQTSNTFVLVDTDGTATGRPAAPGSSEILQTGNAVLHLDQTTVVPGGPTAPDVTLNLTMTFKSEAAGQGQRDYRVEVNATDDFGRQQGFAQAGTLTVQRTAVTTTATLTGSASSVGSGTDNGSIRLQGKFTATDSVALNEATLTLTSVLAEVSGAGELTGSAGGASVLPLTLGARAGGKATDAIYETPSGVRPIVWAEIKTRDANTGLTEFYIKVDRATIAAPVACSAGSSPTTQLRTTFSVQVTGVATGLDVTLPWRCLSGELQTTRGDLAGQNS